MNANGHSFWQVVDSDSKGKRIGISSFIKKTKEEASIVPSSGISSPISNVVVIGCKINTFP